MDAGVKEGPAGGRERPDGGRERPAGWGAMLVNV